MDSDGNTSINVNSTTDQITLQPGEFKIFGNQSSTLLSVIESDINDIIMYPNPADEFIVFNNFIDSVRIYDVTGKELLVYYNINEGQQLHIKNLDSGYYIVKYESQNIISTKPLIIK
tara:strand:- start:239 stop:589 length:351 start_codon:yes stop_codon:yes gene_type:complete